MMPLSVARRVQLATQPFKLTITWHPPNRPGLVSAWDAARTAYGAQQFDALSHDAQTAAARAYINR